MKVISLILLSGIAYLNAAPTTTAPDYRQKYDHLLMEMINERIRSGEAFIEHLSHQLKEFQTSHSEDVRQHIVKELEFILPLVKGADQHFVEELKKTGLDMMEKYTIQKAKSTCDLIVKLLTEVQTQVNKKPVFEIFAATEKPVDYRKEYDRLLYQTINEHIARADGALLMLNRQLDEYLKTKKAEIKDRIVKEVDFIVPLLKAADGHAKTELKRTDLNHLERFLYEKADDEVQLLLKHYTQIENAVKGKLFETFAATVAPVVDWRSEYDRLLFEMIEQNTRRADGFLVELQRQFNDYKETKNKDILERVAKEVEFTVPMVKRGVEMAESELKRTDLNHVERYLYEKVRDESNILLKHFTQLANEIKKP